MISGALTPPVATVRHALVPASCSKRVVCQSSAHSLLGSIRGQCGQCHPPNLQDWSAQACRIYVMHTHRILAAIIVGRSRPCRPLRAQPTVVGHGSKGQVYMPTLTTRPDAAHPQLQPVDMGVTPKESSSSLLARGNGHTYGRGMRLWLESDDGNTNKLSSL